ncbi:DUF4249 domain-containing protein [Rufibacter latericius]|uniref:DUF4249 domain-containing protein n=1 Tax=Rufibacter latericius TaxID=2487040 RepID=A0A3M9N2Z5_9BACT|nr:DUF4249 domain-containing protein [Rufibacter latericius]RNI31533.1 DUF4249 domain-containing protein [Rufibacter latericius]
MLPPVFTLFSGKGLKSPVSFKRGLGCLALAVALAGCEKEVDIEVRGHTPRLAVQYNLNTDSPKQNMYIGRSQSVLAGDNLWRNGLVKDASITISEGNGSVRQSFVFVPLEYNAEQGNYKPLTAFTPEPGREYTLRVSAPNFEAIEGKLTMPTAVPVVSTSFQPDAKHDPYNFSGLLRVQFNDPVGQRNYYRLFVQLLDDQGRPVGNAYSRNENDDIFGEEVEKIELYKVFDDGWANQGVITFSDKIGTYTGGGAPATQLEVTLQHITSDLYLYERSKDNYEEDNPFAEPLNLHSNIRNGYGNFGGITVTKYRINL